MPTADSPNHGVDHPEAPGDHPLAGIRVLDTSTSYAGPTASMYLGDLGADVLKVERPLTGDDARSWGPPFVGRESAWFLSANRNKRSACLDLGTEAGRATLMRMVAGVDVFIQNLNPGKLQKAGLHPDELRQRFPGLICCVVSGFGLDGPERTRPGYDLIAQARSGLMSLTGPPGGRPERVSAPISDVAAGMLAAMTISAALVRKGRTGVGDVIDISLVESDMALIAPRIAAYLAGEEEPQPSGSMDSVLAIYQAFDTADEPVVLAVGNDGMWQRCCAVLGLEEQGAAEDFADNAGRRSHRTELVQVIAERMRAKPSSFWVERFAAAAVPCQPVMGLARVVSDEQIRARGAIGEYRSSDGEPYRTVRAPWKLASTDRGPDAGAPALGRDTVGALEMSGFSKQEIEALIEEGIAWQSPATKS